MKDCQHIVLDAGHISVVSKLADKSATNEVKAKEKQEYSDEDYVRLESLMYDKYYIELESAQVSSHLEQSRKLHTDRIEIAFDGTFASSLSRRFGR